MEDGSNRKTMKRFINIFTAFAVTICAVSCNKSETDVQKHLAQELVGEWHLTEAAAEGVVITSDIDIYLAINSDCTFELYQTSGSQSVRYDKFTGICQSSGDILYGEYNSGEPWASRYTFKIDEDILTLKSYNRLEEQKYVKAEIPADIKDNANVITKSAAATLAPIL